MENTKDIFCTKCQEVTPHTGKVDNNGEFVFTCTAVMVPNPRAGETKDTPKEVGHAFIKFPGNMAPEDIEAKIEENQVVNEGEVSIEDQENKLNTLMGITTKNEVVEDDEDEDDE